MKKNNISKIVGCMFFMLILFASNVFSLAPRTDIIEIEQELQKDINQENAKEYLKRLKDKIKTGMEKKEDEGYYSLNEDFIEFQNTLKALLSTLKNKPIYK